MDVTTKPERLQRPALRDPQDALADRDGQRPRLGVLRLVRVVPTVRVEQVEQHGEAEHRLGGPALQADRAPARVPCGP